MVGRFLEVLGEIFLERFLLKLTRSTSIRLLLVSTGARWASWLSLLSLICIIKLTVPLIIVERVAKSTHAILPIVSHLHTTISIFIMTDERIQVAVNRVTARALAIVIALVVPVLLLLMV